MPPPPTFDVRLASARRISPNVRELAFERVDGATFDFKAGQWVSLVLPLADGEARRAYSIASPPMGTSRFEIAVTRVDEGPGSTFLHQLAVGATLRTIGPQGFFTRTPGAPSLFVGTGTGVTPLRSMIQDALAHGEAKPIVLLLGVRHEADRLYVEENAALEAAHPHFKAFYTLTRADPEWPGKTGYVQTHVATLFRELETSGAPHVYVCGLERMVGAVRDLLRKEMNVERKQVHTERYD